MSLASGPPTKRRCFSVPFMRKIISDLRTITVLVGFVAVLVTGTLWLPKLVVDRVFVRPRCAETCAPAVVSGYTSSWHKNAKTAECWCEPARAVHREIPFQFPLPAVILWPVLSLGGLIGSARCITLLFSAPAAIRSVFRRR